MALLRNSQEWAEEGEEALRVHLIQLKLLVAHHSLPLCFFVYSSGPIPVATVLSLSLSFFFSVPPIASAVVFSGYALSSCTIVSHCYIPIPFAPHIPYTIWLSHSESIRSVLDRLQFTCRQSIRLTKSPKSRLALCHPSHYHQT
jgi:hypothetical protein